MGPAAEMRQSVSFTAGELAGLRELVEEARGNSTEHAEFEVLTEISERLGEAIVRLGRKTGAGDGVVR